MSGETSEEQTTMIEEGQQVFRYDTFGSEAFWGDTLRLHEAVAKLPPAKALELGLKVDSDALPAQVIEQLKAGKLDLNDPAVTLTLLGLEEVLDLSARMYRTSNLVLIDAHTLQTHTGGMSWIPIPKGGETNFTGMLTIDLPSTVRAGQAFTVVVRQVTGAGGRIPTGAAGAVYVGRRILGSFQITIPVRTKEVILASEQRLLSNLRWIERAIPATDRWFLVFRRYVSQVASRIDGLGGDSGNVAPSPSGDWQRPTPTSVICRALEIATSALLAMLVILGATTGAVQVVLGLFGLTLLFVVGYAWVRNCRPTRGRLLATLVLGLLVGLVILILLRAVGP